MCSVCFCSLLPRLTHLLTFLDILHCLPRAVGVPLESALNLVSPMSPCGAHDTHACCARSNDHLLFVMIELMIQVFIEVRIKYLSQHHQLPAVLLCLWRLSHLLLLVKDKVSLVILWCSRDELQHVNTHEHTACVGGCVCVCVCVFV